MGTPALAVAPYAGVNTPWRRAVWLPLFVTWSGGEPSIDATRSAPGFTVAHLGAGHIEGTMPAGTRASLFGLCFSPPGNDNTNFISPAALDSKAGTFHLHVHNSSGVNADPGDGDELWLNFLVEGS